MIGITYHEFWGMNPHIIKFYAEQYKNKKNEEDVLQWRMGQYMAAAIGCIFPKGKYPKKPMFQIKKKEGNNEYSENNEEIAAIEMKLRTRLLEKQGLPESPM